LLLLVQLGGLGILTFTTLIILVLGRRITLRGEALVTGPEAVPHLEPAQLLRSIVRYTLLIEGAGALALWLAWMPRLGVTGAVWPAIFHSIAAFCNAGFSVLPGGIAPFAGDPTTLLILSMLVIVGG